MARPSGNERNKELQHWNQVLSGVDKNIRMPDSLRGEALRHRLDELPAPPEKKRFETSRLFSFQSVVSYAVMFALIVAVYYGMNISPAPLTEGQFAVPEAAPQMSMARDTDAGAVPSSAAAAAAQAQATAPSGGDAAIFDAPLPAGNDVTAESAGDEALIPSGRGARITEDEDIVAGDATGGGGEANTLGEWGDYTLTWRENDPTDPDKLLYPVTLDIVDSATAALVCQIDIEDMASVTDFLIEGDFLVLTGSSGTGMAMNSYSGFSSFEPVLTGTVRQPGRYVTSRFYQGVVYTASHAPADEPLPDGLQAEALEDSLDSGVCYIGALDAASGATGLLGLQNAGEDITLFERHAYLSFLSPVSPGAGEDGTEVRVATIALDGVNLALERID